MNPRRSVHRITLTTLLAIATLAGLAHAGAAHDPRGIWQGTLLGKLRLVVHVEGASVDALKGAVDSPDQGAMGLPVSTTTFSGDTLKLELANLGASFLGVMAADGGSIAGRWSQAGNSLPLTIARTDSAVAAPAAPKRPQEPHPPFPYESENVSYPGGAPGVTLAGTLTKPAGAGPFPCALLITGSGPQDRDETVFGHRPFLVIADRLTRDGFAVLRVDDRGVGGSTGAREGSTSEDFAADVRAGLAYLRLRKDVDAKRIGLVRHSEGGLIAPMLAADPKQNVAFVVLLAGPGVPGEEILLAQGEAIGRAMGKGDADVEKERRAQLALFAIARQPGLDSAAVAVRVHDALRDAGLDSATVAAEAPQSVMVARSPWMRYFLAYDPRPALRRLKCPVLALNGGKDLQVPPRQNLPEIEKALKAGHNHDFEVHELPNLNHLFQACTTGSPGEYATIEETFSPVALDAMSAWLKAHELK